MDTNDVAALSEISHNDNVYRYISPFLYNKTDKFLETAIKNLGGRDFDKKQCIIAGIYLKNEPEHLVGLAEMFDYKKKNNTITVGYRVNEKYWNQKIATNALGLMRDYLIHDMELAKLQAFVMPDNIYSAKTLLRCGFTKEDYTVEEKNWAGQESVTVDVYTFTR